MTLPNPTSLYQPGYVVGCNACLNRWRVEALVRSVAGHPKHCPYCGSLDVSIGIDQNADMWYNLAAGCGFPKDARGVEIVKGLFEIWPQDEYERFVDFVKAFKEGSDEPS